MWKVETMDAVASDEHLKAVREAKQTANRMTDTDWVHVLAQVLAFNEKHPNVRAIVANPALARPAMGTNPLRDAALHMYEDTQALDALRQAVRSVEQFGPRSAVCPYCGINDPCDTEHQVPKSAYPELCAYGRNLIPACGDCNGLKGSLEWADLWIPCVDDPLDIPPVARAVFFLEGVVGSIRYESVPPQTADGDRMLRTCNKLRLFDKWERRATKVAAGGLKKLVLRMKPPDLLQFLTDAHSDELEAYGPHHYHVLMLECALTSPAFQKWLCERETP